MKSRVLFPGVMYALAVLTLASLSTAQLNGGYTIDPNGTGAKSFKTFAAAVSALGGGVSGPVVFAVASATFNESVTLSPVTGASSTNTITFIAGGAPAIIQATGANGLYLNGGCAHFIFENLEIKGATTDGIYLAYTSATKQRVTFCKFKKVMIDMPASASTTINALESQQAQDLTFEECTFAGGGRTFYSQGMFRGSFDRCLFDGKGMARRVVSPWNANDSDCIFTNCTVIGAGSTGYGIWTDYSGHGIMLWHNTIVVNSSAEAVRLGGCCGWSRANSFRNNVVVNLGTGPALVYGWDARKNGLDYNDSDYNCFHAPKATNGSIGIDNNSFRGSLSAWKTYLKNNPGIIITGGGTTYDQNSIEADPGLVSMTAPVDVHLMGGSPCIDAGTTIYIAGAWISYNPSATVPVDFEGEARGTSVDIGADEVGVRILASGSTSPGSTLVLDLISTADAGLVFQLGSSLGGGPIPIGKRKLGLSLDALLDATVHRYLWWIFRNYQGVLDTRGKAQASINIPNLPALKGTRIFSAFLTFKAGAPMGIASISPTLIFTIS